MACEKTIILANPRGFCAGVSRAIEIVDRVLEKYSGHSVYVLHEVVHNKHVVEDLKQKGAIFVEHVRDIPVGGIVVFSAHGVSEKVVGCAKKRNLQVFDATCPIVEKVHRKVRRLSALNEEIIMIGHPGHQEVEGTLGQYTSDKGGMYIVTSEADINGLLIQDPETLHFVTQTTLSVDETRQCIESLKIVFPKIKGPSGPDICYATQNRQQAVKEVANLADVVLVVGSKNSSNSNRLSEVARSAGCESYLIDDYRDLTDQMLLNKNKVAVTGGASAPEYLINDLLKYLQSKGFSSIKEIGSSREKQSFKMPEGL